MLYKLTILLFGLLCFSCNNDENAGPKSKNVWTQKNDFGGGVRSRMISFSVNGKGYAGLGLGEDETGLHTFNDFWEYSPESDQWVQKKDLPQWVLGMVGLSIGNKGYLLTFGSTLLEYDPVADTWTERAPFPFSRAGQCGFVINGKIYAGTGYDPSKTNEIFNDWWEYDPATDEWTQKADVPSPGRAESAAWATADKGFLGSGYYNGGVYNDFWEYDPVADQWTSRKMPGAHFNWGIAFKLNDRPFFGYPIRDDVHRSNLFQYDPSSDTWIQKAVFKSGLCLETTSFTIGNAAYVVGGIWNSEFSDQVWQYEY